MAGVNYDEIAATYDRRYAVASLAGIALALTRPAARASFTTRFDFVMTVGRRR